MSCLYVSKSEANAEYKIKKSAGTHSIKLYSLSLNLTYIFVIVIFFCQLYINEVNFKVNGQKMQCMCLQTTDTL